MFVYKGCQGFDLAEHEARFRVYDKWQGVHYEYCQRVRASGQVVHADNPVAYFTLEDEW